jgi:hypothetical protein
LWTQEVATEPGLVREERKAEELAYSTNKDRKIEVLRLGLGGDHLAAKSTFSGSLFDGARMWTYYRCLPDTVDPRGPKGK